MTTDTKKSWLAWMRQDNSILLYGVYDLHEVKVTFQMALKDVRGARGE